MPAVRALAATATALSIALIVAACGGGTASPAASGDGTSSQAPATDAPPSSEPTTTTASDAPDPSVIALPSFDLDDLLANLEGVDSYRTVMTVDGEPTYEAKVVTKPVLSKDITISDNGADQRIVVIGDEAWIGTGDELQPAPAEMATAMLGLFDPMLMAGAFATPGAMAGAEDLGTEEKNGVQATHYRIDATSMVGTLASMPPGTSIELWVADEGYLVSLAVVSAEGGFAIDVFDVNDPSITVERPS